MAEERKGSAAEFKEFVLRGNVVDLAVAVIIGAAFGAVVAALVKDIVTPIIAAIFGKPNFADLRFTINRSTFLYGDFLNTVVTFVSVAAAVFFLVVKPINYVHERRKRASASGLGDHAAAEDAAPPSTQERLLTEIRDLLRTQRRA